MGSKDSIIPLIGAAIPDEPVIDESEVLRDATASIRGYMYQFMATIDGVLNLDDGGELIIEGVEDFDSINSPEDIQHCQCKYYATQNLTDAVIRDAITPMLQGYLTLPPERRTVRKYKLYGHFKNNSSGPQTLSTDDLKRILVKTTRPKEGAPKKINLQTQLGASDIDLENFSRALTIVYSKDYESYKQDILISLSREACVSQTEAEEYTYPTAINIISDMATQASLPDRTITKANFLSKLKPSQAIYNIWIQREKGESAFAKEIKKRYFSTSINVESANRFFAIDVMAGYSLNEIYALLRLIITRWSTHAIQRKPNAERYAPYVLINGLSDADLSELKGMLVSENIKFQDGYPYRDSGFRPDFLHTQQTKENRIAVRLLDNIDNFNIAIATLNNPKNVYHFYTGKPLYQPDSGVFIGIPVNSVKIIKTII